MPLIFQRSSLPLQEEQCAYTVDHARPASNYTLNFHVYNMYQTPREEHDGGRIAAQTYLESWCTLFFVKVQNRCAEALLVYLGSVLGPCKRDGDSWLDFSLGEKQGVIRHDA